MGRKKRRTSGEHGAKEVLARSGAGIGGTSALPGDWHCPCCGYRNRAFRNGCRFGCTARGGRPQAPQKAAPSTVAKNAATNSAGPGRGYAAAARGAQPGAHAAVSPESLPGSADGQLISELLEQIKALDLVIRLLPADSALLEGQQAARTSLQAQLQETRLRRTQAKEPAVRRAELQSQLKEVQDKLASNQAKLAEARQLADRLEGFCQQQTQRAATLREELRALAEREAAELTPARAGRETTSTTEYQLRLAAEQASQAAARAAQMVQDHLLKVPSDDDDTATGAGPAVRPSYVQAVKAGESQRAHVPEAKSLETPHYSASEHLSRLTGEAEGRRARSASPGNRGR